jgi:O-antigen ligase
MNVIANAQFASPVMRSRMVRFHVSLLAQIAICVGPGMALVGLGRPELAAHIVPFTVFCFLVFYLFQQDRYRFLSLLIGALPVLGFLRGLFFYHGVTLFLAVGIGLWGAVDLKEFAFVWKDIAWRWLVALCLVYWWASVIYTGDYFSNSRFLDFALSLTGMYLLANQRGYLATALVGIAISATTLAMGLLPLAGDRLGLAMVGDMEIGNPIQMGVPTALIVLLCLSDNGRWLLLEDKPWLRLVIFVTTSAWLVLSGSRGSWVVVIAGFAIILLFGKQDRRPSFGALVLFCVGLVLLLSTDRGSKVTAQYDRSVDSDRSLKSRTSGRSVQWEVLPDIFAESPVWGWGPGSARDVDWLFTKRHLEWHALYIQIIAETGILGFIPLMTLLGIFLYRGILHLRRYGEIAPLICVVTFMVLGLSVTAVDALGGVILGLGLASRRTIPRYVIREQLRAVDEIDGMVVDI